MAEQRFNIVFQGKIAVGYDVNTVKRNLQKLTKLDAGHIERLFATPETIIKSNIDGVTAERYMTALKHTGAICQLVPLDKLNAEVQEAPKDTDHGLQQITCPKCGTRQQVGISCATCGIVFRKYIKARTTQASPVKPLHHTIHPLIFILLFLLLGGAGAAWWSHMKGPINKTQNKLMRKVVGQMLGGSIQNQPLNLSGVVTVFAGLLHACGANDGMGTSARFTNLCGITTDGIYLYVTDELNCTIRKIDISTGAVSTLAGTAPERGANDGVGGAARFLRPRAITIVGDYLYVPQGDTIRKINKSTGAVTTMSVGLEANYITTDGRHLYATGNHGLVKINIDNGSYTEIHLLLENLGKYENFESYGTRNALTTDGTYLYLTDNKTIKKIEIATGLVTNMVGVNWGPDYASSDYYGHGITTDGQYIYVNAKNEKIVDREIIRINIFTNEIGIITSSRFDVPTSITTDGENLYVSELNGCIKKISASISK